MRQSADIGMRSLEAEAQKLHRRWSEFLKAPHLETVLSFSDLPDPTLEDVYSRIGFGRLSASTVLRKLLPGQGGGIFPPSRSPFPFRNRSPSSFGEGERIF